MEKFARVSSVNREAKCPEKIIELAEDNYSAYINEAAEMILSSGKPVVLLSGPSGSGKTTAALRIEARLRELGRTAHTLSMDNYFLPISDKNRHELPRDDEGNIDLESPMRLDIPLFTEHLKKIAACEEFEMPRFNFAAQSRREPVPFLRKHGEIIIIEGIHALNPDVTIEVQQSDSSSGMTDAIDGTCDIGMASRELKDSETSEGLTPTVIALDGIAVIVNNDSPVTNLTSQQVKDIFTGVSAVWSDVLGE